jgi:hypothetical protein
VDRGRVVEEGKVVEGGKVGDVWGAICSCWQMGATVLLCTVDIRQLESCHQNVPNCETIRAQSSVFPRLVLGRLGPQNESVRFSSL